MDQHQAARALSVATKDVLELEHTGDGVAVTVQGGGRRLIRDDGVYALDDHPANRGRRRWETTAEQADGGEADPAEGTSVPDGSAEDVLGWVGDDVERAAAALEAETGREHPRSTLVSKLRKLAG